MAWLSTEIDLGDCGTCSVQVEYKQGAGFVSIRSVMWNGTDITGYLTSKAEDSLVDICKAEIFEFERGAAEAEWDRKQDERRLSCEQRAI